MSDIFISYRNEGGFPTANHLAEKLKRDGYRVVFDKSSLRESGRFDEIIKSQIEDCLDFIVVLDKNAFERTSSGSPKETDWLRRELAYALERNKNIIPIMLPGFTWPKQMPDDIINVRNHNGPKYSRDYFGGFYNELITFLNSKKIESTGLESTNSESTNITETNLESYRPVKSNVWKIITSLLALVLVGIILYFSGKKPVLLFHGGGSVKGYITDSINSTAFDNGIYLPMPSTSAWPIIAEELSIGPYYEKSRDYYIILMSAEKAEADAMVNKETKSVFFEKIGYVAEIQIGESQLQVAYSEELDSVFSQHKPIHPIDILRLINNNEINVFSTTQYLSGTWKKYNLLLQSKLEDDTIRKRIKRFEKNDSPAYFTSPYIILESATYKAEKIEDTLRRVKVWDTNNKDLATCPMCIYFVVYNTDKNDTYIVPKQVRSFLSKVGINNFPKDGSPELRRKNDNLIRHYNQAENRFEN